ncbi:hypothetical protein [Marilutibacter alkalisoli]|uniref:Uncharacterized protein n=1 Tax=Marilutibacter alkalisoli TaxID=2591633 RepID=A0A514BSR7_9GAMM|nr:hypothetical protein [Lysobacter alkalisoli]QDH70444.1 hypothetical protein FKV23_10395 [Lysobacter alkalisoli]
MLALARLGLIAAFTAAPAWSQETGNPGYSADEALDIEKDEARQMDRTFRKLRKAVPVVKAARYLQVENKLRAIVRFEQAVQVPYAR